MGTISGYRLDMMTEEKGTTMKTTIVWGRMTAVHEQAMRHGAVMQRVHPNGWSPGDFHETEVVGFEGGYDDYAGALAWAEITAELPGGKTRFSPAPGVWMEGVRVCEGLGAAV